MRIRNKGSDGGVGMVGVKEKERKANTCVS